MGKQNKYSIKSRIWICTDDGTYLGEGRVNLLIKIKELGSISQAAKEMKMSYKKAWELVKSMNEQSPTPLVERTIGGNGGGGTTLTKEGEKAIKLFKEINLRCKNSLDKEINLINF